jgi:hypothetical protein
MRNGYREKAIACAILHHLESYLFLWEQKRRNPIIWNALCICEGDCVSVENHEKHWIHLGPIISIDKNTKTAVVKWEETREKDTVHLGDCKKYKKWTSFQGNGNQQISFVRYHRDKEGEATSWPNEKHVFF